MNATSTKTGSRRAESDLLGAPRAARSDSGRVAPTHRGWRAAGWFGLLVAVIGFADLGLHLFRPAFGTPEWEFATMAAVLASLPLPTLGLAALVAALLVNRARVPIMVAASMIFVLALLIAAAYTIFVLNLPLALAATDGPQGTAIYRTIARSTIMAVGFGFAYLTAGIMLLRHLPQRSAA